MLNKESYRFPSRPVKIVETAPLEEGEDDDKSGSEEGEINLVPTWIQNALPNTSAWKYHSVKKYVFNSLLQKKINLENLDTSDKILKIISAFESVPEMDSATFIIALQQASYEIYSMPLSCILQQHINGDKISWGATLDESENKVETPVPINHTNKHKKDI